MRCHARPGGKGLNVARTLHAIGADVLVLGLAGGHHRGRGGRRRWPSLGVPAGVHPDRRRDPAHVHRGGRPAAAAPPCSTSRDRGSATDEFADSGVRYEEALDGCAAVVLSGSLPPGLPAGCLRRADRDWRPRPGCPCVLDAHGEALRLRRGGRAGDRQAEPGRAGRRWPGRSAGTARAGRPWPPRPASCGQPAPQAVVVSLGADGLLAVTEDGSWVGGPARRGGRERDRRGRRGGRGAWRTGWCSGRPWPERLRHAVALGTAVGRGPGGRGVQPGRLRQRLLAGVTRATGDGGGLMPLTPMATSSGPARAAGRGVGAFNVIGIEHAEAIVAGAEAAGAPVVLQISENCAAYHGALAPIASGLPGHRGRRPRCRSRCTWTTRPARTWSGRRPGWASGRSCTTRRPCPTPATWQATADVARWCQRPGHLGGGGARRDRRQERRARAGRAHRPDEAAGYVAATGVDALAVAVGSSHAMLTRDAVLDLGLIARIRAAVSVPLVLHGSSGVPDAGPGRGGRARE